MAEDLTRSDQDITEYLNAINRQNTDNLITTLGLQRTAGGCRFYFFDRQILFDHQDFIDISGEELSLPIKEVLCKYLTSCTQPTVKESARLVTFREFSKNSPLFYRFAENTSKTIEQTFSGRTDILEQKCIRAYGTPVDNSSYDLCIRFKALPKIPIALQFNDVDEMLPAKATFLFHEDAVNYLDVKSLGSIMTYLSGLLIN